MGVYRVLAWLGAAMVMAGWIAPASAQEIVVTAMRRGGGIINTPSVAPALMLKRTADFAVQRVTVTGDTRDPDKRHDEIYAMIRGAIAVADKAGVQLATGETVVEPLTLANYRNLKLESDGDRDDTESATFLVKVPLTPGIDAKAALDRFARFIKSVPPVGRAEMSAADDLSLSVVQPEQYRGEIVKLIADETARTAAAFGDGYGVDVSGLDGPVRWSSAGLTEVYLYLAVNYSVVPKR